MLVKGGKIIHFNICNYFFHFIREISIDTEGGSEWARGEAPAKDASQMLKGNLQSN